MLKHGLKLVLLLTVAVVAPASAGQLRTDTHDWACPYEERAKLAAEGYEVLPVTTVGDPAEGSFFDVGRRAVFAP